MKSPLIVSAVQMKVLSAKKNLPKILAYMKKAAKIGADIVCFPECALNSSVKNPSSEKDLTLLQKACLKENIYVIINGYFKEKNNVFNRTYIITSKGKISGFYDKIYLWIDEKNNVRRGRTIRVIKTPLAKIGLCTCWDLFFPKIFEELKKRGAEIIFCPSYWVDTLKKEHRFLDGVPAVVAYQYMLFFVYCNAFLKGKTSISQISSPWGELDKIEYEEGMITAKLYPNRLKRFKKHFRRAFWERNLFS